VLGLEGVGAALETATSAEDALELSCSELLLACVLGAGLLDALEVSCTEGFVLCWVLGATTAEDVG